MAEQWEYKTLVTAGLAWHSGVVDTRINQLAQQGWEVAGMASEGGTAYIIFKRRKV